MYFDPPFPTTRRLVVLVPDFDIDEIVVGRRIWDLAIPRLSSILFLSVAQNPDEELRALHKVAVLSAVTNDSRIRIETRIQWGVSWQKAIRQFAKPGDLVVCFSNHMMRVWVFWRKPLSSLLESRVDAPIYILSEKNFAGQYTPGNLTLKSTVH